MEYGEHDFLQLAQRARLTPEFYCTNNDIGAILWAADEINRLRALKEQIEAQLKRIAAISENAAQTRPNPPKPHPNPPRFIEAAPCKHR